MKFCTREFNHRCGIRLNFDPGIGVIYFIPRVWSRGDKFKMQKCFELNYVSKSIYYMCSAYGLISFLAGMRREVRLTGQPSQEGEFDEVIKSGSGSIKMSTSRVKAEEMRLRKPLAFWAKWTSI